MQTVIEDKDLVYYSYTPAVPCATTRMGIVHAPTGVAVYGEGKLIVRLRRDLLRELREKLSERVID